jgi:hypothetical protein
MAIHTQDDEQVCKEYWKKVTSLDDKNFMTTIVKAPSVARRPLPYGTVTVRYNSLGLLRQIKDDISRLIDRCEKSIAVST